MHPNEEHSSEMQIGEESAPSSSSGSHRYVVDKLRDIMKAKEKRSKDLRREREAAASAGTERPRKMVEISIAQHLFGTTSVEDPRDKKDPRVKFVRITADQVIILYALWPTFIPLFKVNTWQFCSICFCDFVEGQKLMRTRKCKHFFCPSCLSRWMQQTQYPTCAHCRQLL